MAEMTLKQQLEAVYKAAHQQRQADFQASLAGAAPVAGGRSAIEVQWDAVAGGDADGKQRDAKVDEWLEAIRAKENKDLKNRLKEAREIQLEHEQKLRQSAMDADRGSTSMLGTDAASDPQRQLEGRVASDEVKIDSKGIEEAEKALDDLRTEKGIVDQHHKELGGELTSAGKAEAAGDVVYAFVKDENGRDTPLLDLEGRRPAAGASQAVIERYIKAVQYNQQHEELQKLQSDLLAATESYLELVRDEARKFCDILESESTMAGVDQKRLADSLCASYAAYGHMLERRKEAEASLAKLQNAREQGGGIAAEDVDAAVDAAVSPQFRASTNQAVMEADDTIKSINAMSAAWLDIIYSRGIAKNYLKSKITMGSHVDADGNDQLDAMFEILNGNWGVFALFNRNGTVVKGAYNGAAASMNNIDSEVYAELEKRLGGAVGPDDPGMGGQAPPAPDAPAPGTKRAKALEELEKIKEKVAEGKVKYEAQVINGHYVVRARENPSWGNWWSGESRELSPIEHYLYLRSFEDRLKHSGSFEIAGPGLETAKKRTWDRILEKERKAVRRRDRERNRGFDPSSMLGG